MRIGSLSRQKLCHRGLHTQDQKIPENSIKAFKRAVDNGYGIELDVQLSKDAKVVVFHDSSLNRACGVNGNVSDYYFDELKQLPLFGTGRTHTSVEEALACITQETPIIVELKTGQNNRLLCEKVLDILNSYTGTYSIESFNPIIVGWFRKNAPHIFRGQLSASAKVLSGGKFSILCFMLSRLIFNSYARPHFIAFGITGRENIALKICRALGVKSFAWTAHDPSFEKHSDSVIFEYYSPSPAFNSSSSSLTDGNT